MSRTTRMIRKSLAIMLCVILAFSAVSIIPMVASAEEAEITEKTYEQDSVGFNLIGEWGSVTESGLSGGSAYTTTTVGAKVVFAFTGTEMKLVTNGDAQQGKISVSVDGETETVDLSTLAGKQLEVYTYTSEVSENHEVIITLTGAGEFVFDAVKITGELETVSAQSDLTETLYEIENNDLIEKTGSWSNLTNSALSGGAAIQSTTLGSKITFAFEGTKFEFIGYAATNQGKFRISYDAGTVVDYIVPADLMSGTSSEFKKVLYSKELAEGYHIVEITLFDVNPANNYKRAYFDALNITGTLVAVNETARTNADYTPATKADGINIYDDNDAKIYKQGNWTTTKHASLYGGSVTKTTAIGQSFIFTFKGKGFALITQKSKTQQTAVRVSIDGAEPTVYAQGTGGLLYAPSAEFQAVYYASEQLDRGEHTVVVMYEYSNAILDAIAIDGELVDPVVEDQYSYSQYDADAAEIVYSGSWKAVASARSAYKGGLAMRSYSDRDYAYFTYVGGQFMLQGTVGNNACVMYVSIDGEAEQVIELKGATTKHQQFYYHSEGLTTGTHTVKITFGGSLASNRVIDQIYVEGLMTATDTSAMDVYKDYEPAENRDLIVFGGKWANKSSAYFENNYCYVTTGANATMTFAFNGTGFDIVAHNSPSLGKMYITVDNGEAQEIDLSGAETYKKVIYSLTGLADEDHTVTITAETEKTSVDTIRIVNGTLIKAEAPEVVTYTYTTSATNATISAGGSYTESNNLTTTVTFAANEGFEITSVIVDGTALTGDDLLAAIENGYVVIDHTKNHTVEVVATAVAVETFKVTTSATNATITEGFEYESSATETVTVSFTSNYGYEVTAIMVDGTALTGTTLTTAISNGYVTLDCTGDHTVTVTASPRTFTVSTTATNATIDGGFTFEYSATETFKINFAPVDGYEVTSIVVDGTELVDPELTEAIVAGYITLSRTSVHTVKVVAEVVSNEPTSAVILDCEKEYEAFNITSANDTLCTTAQAKSGSASYGLSASSNGTLSFSTKDLATLKINADKAHSHIKFSAYVSNRLKLNTSSAVTIILGNSATDTTKQVQWVIKRAAFTNKTWIDFTLDFASATNITYTEGSAVDFTNLCYFEVKVTATGAVDTYFDDFILETDAGYTGSVFSNLATFTEEEVFNCEEPDNYLAVTTTAEESITTSNYKVGSGAYDLSSAVGSLSTSFETAKAGAIDLSITDTSKFKLKMWIYFESTNKMANFSVFLSSSGTSSNHYYKWVIPTSDLKLGWAEYELTFADSRMTRAGSPNSKKLNYIKVAFYSTDASVIYLDNIRFCNASEENTYKRWISKDSIADMKYPTNFTPVYNINAADGVYGADPTGVNDSTTAIQNALDDLFKIGGGTVYLPAGNYLVTRNIMVPTNCTILGDYQDPDSVTSGKPEYGTIIQARPTESTSEYWALFFLHSSSGVNGITVYYPEQSLNDIKQYEATFAFSATGHYEGDCTDVAKYGISHELASIKNVTVINGYRGIVASTSRTNIYHYVHETLTIENFKGSFIDYGMKAYNSSDVDTFTDMTVDPKYWANANTAVLTGLTVPTSSELTTYTKANTSGLILGDIEWGEFYNINLSGLKYGIHIVYGSGRASFSGSMAAATITNCASGITVDYYAGENSFVNSIDPRWGFAVTNSTIQGGINNQSAGVVKLCNVTTSGTLVGTTTYNGNSGVISFGDDIVYKAAKTTGTAIETVKTGSTAAQIQTALNKVGNAGGGVVYLRPGYYTINQTLYVPANVELHGSGSPVRGEGTWGIGVVFCCDYGTGGIATSGHAVVLNGANAGITGIRLIDRTNLNAFYSNGLYNAAQANGYDVSDLSSYTHGYMISGAYANNYVTSCEVTGATHGIRLTGSGHVVRNANTWCMINAVYVSGGGQIQSSLQNGTLADRNGFSQTINGTESGIKIGDNIGCMAYNGISKRHLNHVIVAGGTEKLLNVFSFGSHNAFYFAGGTSYAMNIAADQIGYVDSSRQGGYAVVAESGATAYVANLLRVYGSSYYRYSGASLYIYNRLTIWNDSESNVG